MIVDKKIEKKEKSSVLLTVTVDKDFTKKEYNELLNKYSKEAVIKGFRKGKVPPSVLEQKFGDSIRQESMASIIDTSLKEVFEQIEEKPLGYSYPELQGEPAMNPGEEFTYSIIYDIFPEIKLGEYKGLTISEPQAKITKEDEASELKKLQEENSFVVEKKDKTVAKDSIVTLNYCELNDDNSEKEATRRDGFTMTVGTSPNYYKLDDDIIGMQLNEEKTIEKTFPNDSPNTDLAGKSIKIRVKVTAIKEKQLPDLDDELAQDISDKYKTLDDLKKDIKSKLEDNLSKLVRQKKIDQIIDQLVASSQIDLPESMIKTELEGDWQNMLRRVGATEQQIMPLLSRDGDSKEAILEKWTPDAEKRIKSQLIIGRLIENEKIEISDAVVDEEIKKRAEEAGMKADEYKKSFGDQRLIQYLKNEMSIEKLFDFLLENVKISKGDKIKYADLIQA